MDKVVVVIDDDTEVLTNVAVVMKKEAEDVKLFTFLPGEIDTLPKNTDVFVVDFDMAHTSGPKVVSKIRKNYPEAWIVGWGVSSKDPQATGEMIEFFEAGVNRIIDKHVKNVAKVVKTLLKIEFKKIGTLHPSTQFGW